MGLIIPKTKDGRVLFFLPWEGMTLCGTTDCPAPISRTPAPTADDVAFILEEANRYLNRKVTHADVKAAWSGIRPLVKDPSLPLTKGGTAQISRQVCMNGEGILSSVLLSLPSFAHLLLLLTLLRLLLCSTW